jgi:hypothetical protein
MDRSSKLRTFLRANGALLIVVAVAVGGWLFLRTSATPLESAASLDRVLARGEPVVLEFFGNT